MFIHERKLPVLPAVRAWVHVQQTAFASTAHMYQAYNLTDPCVCLSVSLSDVTSSVPDRLSFGGIFIAVLVYKQAMSVLHKQRK